MQMARRELEIWADSLNLVRCLGDMDAIPTDVLAILEHCLSFKSFFLYCIMKVPKQ